MKKILATTAVSLLIAGSVSAGGPFKGDEADVLTDPTAPGKSTLRLDQEAGQQAFDAGGTQVDSSRPYGTDPSGRGGQITGAPVASFDTQ